ETVDAEVDAEPLRMPQDQPAAERGEPLYDGRGRLGESVSTDVLVARAPAQANDEPSGHESIRIFFFSATSSSSTALVGVAAPGSANFPLPSSARNFASTSARDMPLGPSSRSALSISFWAARAVSTPSI